MIPLPGDIIPEGTVIASCHGREEGDADDFCVLLFITPTAPFFHAAQFNSEGKPVSTITWDYNITDAVQSYLDMGGDPG